MKKFKLIATIVAFVLIISAIGFNVYAALLSQRSISNQIIFNTDKALIYVHGSFHYMETDSNGNYLNSWSEPLSTFTANNASSPEGELNNQNWNLEDINFNQHKKYLIKIVFSVDQDKYLKVEGFNIDPEHKYQISYSVVKGASIENSGILANTSLNALIEANTEYTLNLEYELLSYRNAINLQNHLMISFEDQL